MTTQTVQPGLYQGKKFLSELAVSGLTVALNCPPLISGKAPRFPPEISWPTNRSQELYIFLAHFQQRWPTKAHALETACSFSFSTARVKRIRPTGQMIGLVRRFAHKVCCNAHVQVLVIWKTQQSCPLSLQGSKMKPPESTRKGGALYHVLSCYQPDPPLCEDTCKGSRWFLLQMTTCASPSTKGTWAWLHCLSQEKRKPRRWPVCSFQYDGINIQYQYSTFNRQTHLSGCRGHSC